MRFYLHTFGCKANQYDSEAVRQALESAGAQAVNDPDAADFAIVNSCTVTHTGEAKMRGFVRRLSRGRPRLQTVIMGCAAALDDGALASLPGVVSVVAGSDPIDVLSAVGLDTDQVDPILRSFARGTRAWLKIQDGCDEHCTFCATTIARGANRSRGLDEIVREAQFLSDDHAELVITGVHIGTYGADRADGSSLGVLMERLIAAVPRVRFRLSSVEATEIDDRLADLLISAPHRLAPHLHAPLQSGSDRVLKRMGRHWYTAQSYRDRLEWLAARLDRFGLGADIIVGFPGESDDDFEATRSMVEALPYTYLHVFPYSERPDAPAGRLGPAVDAHVAKARSAVLREVADRKATAYRASRHGGEADVIVLRRLAGRYEGLTGDYLNVSVTTQRRVGRRTRATLRFREGGLWAEPV